MSEEYKLIFKSGTIKVVFIDGETYIVDEFIDLKFVAKDLPSKEVIDIWYESCNSCAIYAIVFDDGGFRYLYGGFMYLLRRKNPFFPDLDTENVDRLGFVSRETAISAMFDIESDALSTAYRWIQETVDDAKDYLEFSGYKEGDDNES